MRASSGRAVAGGVPLRRRAGARRRQTRRRRVVLFGAISLVAVAVVVGHREQSQSGAYAGGKAVDPSYFSNGACVSLPPTKGNRHITVFLDAGHGGVDPGGMGETESGTTIAESTLNLPVELDAASLLRASGYTVVVSRTANTTVLRLSPEDLSGNVLSLQGSHDDTAARDICANDAHARLLVGIYMDSSSSPYTAGSLTAYDTARPFSASNARFAQLLQTDVLSAMNAKGWQIPDDGVMSDSGLGSAPVADDPNSGLAAMAQAYDHLLILGPAEAGYFNTPSRMPGALIEPLYLSDPFEGSIADSAVGQETIASGIAKAVRAYFAPPKSATVAPATTVGT